jgi:hypothetical protein
MLIGPRAVLQKVSMQRGLMTNAARVPPGLSSATVEAGRFYHEGVPRALFVRDRFGACRGWQASEVANTIDKAGVQRSN